MAHSKRVVCVLAVLAASGAADAGVEGCRITGKIECAGKGVEGVHVIVVPWSKREDEPAARAGIPFSAKTDAEGRYEIADVPAGRATVIVEVGGPAQRMAYFRFVRLPEEKGFDLDLALGNGEVVGRVTKASDGSPLAEWTVFAAPVGTRWDNKASGTQATAETDGEGNFRIRFLKPGSYLVSITGAPFGQDALANEIRFPVEIREDRPARTDLSLRTGGSAAVRVVDAEGKPVADAVIFLVPAGGGMPPIPLSPDPKPGDLPPGSYHAIAVADGFAWSASGTHEVRAEAEASFEVSLGRGVPVTLRVVDEEGQAVQGTLLLSFPVFVDAAGHEFPAFLSDPETGAANWKIDPNRLAPGDYTVRFRLEGFRPLAVPLRVGTEPPPPVVLKLEPVEEPK